MHKVVTVLLLGGPMSGRQVSLNPPAKHTLDTMPPRLTINSEHHRHEYTYAGRNPQKQHYYNYSHTN